MTRTGAVIIAALVLGNAAVWSGVVGRWLHLDPPIVEAGRMPQPGDVIVADGPELDDGRGRELGADVRAGQPDADAPAGDGVDPQPDPQPETVDDGRGDGPTDQDVPGAPAPTPESPVDDGRDEPVDRDDPDAPVIAPPPEPAPEVLDDGREPGAVPGLPVEVPAPVGEVLDDGRG